MTLFPPRIDSTFVRKLSILFAVGFPGLNRMVLFALVSSLATTQELGQFANDFGVMQLLSFLTSVGWGALLTVRSAQELEGKGEKAAASLSVYSLLLLLLAIPVVVLLSRFGLLFSAFWTWLYLAGWSGFNLLRAKCIGASDHGPLLVVEVLILFGTVCIVGLLWRHDAAMKLAAMPFMATGLLWLIWKCAKQLSSVKASERALIEGVTLRRGLQYGFANLTSAGLFYQLPILAAQTGSLGLAGMMGLLLSIVAAIDLVPASITAHYLPQVARYVKEKDYSSYTVLLRRQETVLLLGLLGAIGSVIAGWIVLHRMGNPIVETASADLSFAFILACYFLNHLSNPAANYLQAHERSDLAIRVNVATYVAFWSLYLLPLRDGIVAGELKPLIALLICVGVRSAGMYWLVHRQMAMHRASGTR